MASPSSPTSPGFDPEAHAGTDLDMATVIPDGVNTLTDWVVTKSNPDLDSISCWHCYTYGDVTWCVEIDCPFPDPTTTTPTTVKEDQAPS